MPSKRTPATKAGPAAKARREPTAKAQGRPARRERGPIVADVMTNVVVTLSPDTSVQEAIDLFARRHISGAPVVSDDGKLLGVVSTTDVLRAESSPDARKKERSAYYLEDELSSSIARAPSVSMDRTVLQIATRRVVSIDENAPLSEAARFLLELGIRRLLVTRDGKLAGLVSTTDVVKWVARPAIEAAERD